jgi:hypothetical protein
MLRHPLRRAAVATLLCLAIPAIEPTSANASDHADPMLFNDPESNITGLFFFPKDDRMIVILNVRRQLTKPVPYNLEPFEYAIRMDLHSQVTFDDPAEKARYGGTVVSPDRIKEDVTIAFHLNPDASVKTVTYTGLKNQDQIRVFTGVRDDPFVFPRFFKKNVISMVLSIPRTSFPDGQQDFLLWGTVFKGTTQIDHVGRSNRSQQARFEGLNTRHPSQHVASLMKRMAFWDGLYNPLNHNKETKPIADFVQILLQNRPYDLAPDVMIYSSRFPVGFPNGRLLTDDVAALTCATGDCILQDLSFIEDSSWPRKVVNDHPFMDEFPYLAAPGAVTEPPIVGSLKARVMMAIMAFVAVAVLLWLYRWRLYARATVG